MQKLNLTAAIVFGVLALSRLLTGDWLTATSSALLALGLGLSDLRQVPQNATAVPSALSPGRKYMSMAATCAAIALFGYQIGRDLKAATRHPQATSSLHLPAQATTAALGRVLVATLD